MRKKFLCGVLAATICLSMAACGKEETKELPSNNTPTIEESIETTDDETRGDNKKNSIINVDEQKEEVTTETENTETKNTETTETDVTQSTTATSEVTAESLISGIDNTKHQNETSHSTMSIIMDMSMELPDETGKTNQTSISMVGDYELIGNNETAYVKGNLEMEYMGEKDAQTQEVYSSLEDGVATVYQSIDGGKTWTKTTDDSTNWNVSSTTSNLRTDFLSNLTLEDNGNEYVVKGDFDASRINEVMVGETNSLADTSSIDLSVPIKTELTFNKETLEVTSITFDMTDTMAKSVAAYGMTIDKYYISMRINEYTQDAIVIPDDVKNNAVEDNSVDALIDYNTSTEQ